MKASKKKNKWWLLPFSVLFLLILYTIIIYHVRQQDETEAMFASYPGFGIQLPLGYQVHGIDVSLYQQYVYWPAVKKMEEKNVRINFAFIKATEGLTNIDRQFRRNWKEAKIAGVPRGAYHFFLATKDGHAQAANFIKNVKLEEGDLPPVLDIEELYNVSPVFMRKRVKAWLQDIEAAYDVTPIIYTSTDFYQRYLGDEFSKYPLWVAHYFRENYPPVNRDWWFWQHNNTGKINGIKGGVDFNVFNGDSIEFKKILVK